MVNTLFRRYACDSIGHVWKFLNLRAIKTIEELAIREQEIASTLKPSLRLKATHFSSETTTASIANVVRVMLKFLTNIQKNKCLFIFFMRAFPELFFHESDSFTIPVTCFQKLFLKNTRFSLLEL